MITAAAPAAFAFLALSPNGHVPRWISAIDPGVKPAKSDASQPLVLDGSGVGGTVTSIGTILAWAVPLPEYCMTLKSSSPYVFGDGDTRASDAGAVSSKYGKVKVCLVTS